MTDSLKTKVRTVLFDFDGVIVDSRKDIASSVNVTLEHFGYLPLSEEKIIGFVGHGAHNLLLSSLRSSVMLNNGEMPNEEKVLKILSWYKEYYKEHSTDETTLIPGITELLDILSLAEIRMAIVSNKPVKITEKILEYFGIEDYFDTLIGPELIQKIKPAPDGIIKAVENINVWIEAIYQPKLQPSQVLMVGDSNVDVQAAKAYGCISCGFTGGIGNPHDLIIEKPDVIIHSMSELVSLFK